MNNFGVYAGENIFEFSHSLPVVLIGGMNGRGKTTFLEAILLALYGDNSKAYKESKYKTYGQYLRSYVNKNSWSQSCYIELQFILNEKDYEEYIVSREWNVNEFLTNNWPMFVENIIPSALSSFYFFDGEKIAELAVDSTDIEMKESIRAMLGLTVLDVLKNDLARSLRRTEKNIINENASAELQNSKEEVQQITDEITKIDDDITKLVANISSKKEQIKNLYNTRDIEK